MKFLIRFLSWLFSLPSWEKADAWGMRLGRWLHFLGVRKKVVLENLNLVFRSPETRPELRKTHEEIRTICRRCYENLGIVIVFYLRGSLMNKKYFQEMWDVEGEETLRRAVAQGRPLLFIGGHIGVWEFAIMKMAALGFRAGLIAKEMKNPVVDDWLVRMRAQNGVRTFSSKGSREDIVEAVKQGMVVIAVYDQSMTTRQGVTIDFLGHPASTLKSTPGIVRDAGATVMAGWARRIAPGRCRLYISEEIPWAAREDPDEERLVNTQNYSDAVGRAILEKPEDWFWHHRRWKKRGPAVTA